MFSYKEFKTYINSYQYRSLSNSMFNLILLDKMLLLECLYRVYLLGISLFTEYNLAIGACPYDLDQIKIVYLEATIMQL
jgi:hypothetical protein